MTEIVTKGGPIVWITLALSVFAFAVFFEKLVVIHRSRIKTDKFLSEIEILIRQNKIKEAERLCDRFNTPVTRVVRAGIANLSATRERIANCMEEVALIELPKLESGLGVLTTVAHIAPFLGLLGTVIGMITCFQTIQEKTAIMSAVSPSDLAAGIWVALITTEVGLGVAIPTVIAYNYIRHHVLVIQHDMERAASRILALA